MGALSGQDIVLRCHRRGRGLLQMVAKRNFGRPAHRIQRQAVHGFAERMRQFLGHLGKAEEHLGHDGDKDGGHPAGAFQQRKGDQQAVEIGGPEHQQRVDVRQRRRGDPFASGLGQGDRGQAL